MISNLPVKLSRYWKSRTERSREFIVATVFFVFFLVGTIGHYIVPFRPIMLFVTPYVLFVYGLIALSPLVIQREWCVFLWVGIVYPVTFVLEALGVATGAIFGAYEYGPTLGVQFLSVPVIIGFNWVIVVLGATLFMRVVALSVVSKAQLDRQRFATRVLAVLSPILIGALAVLFDLVLEPVAIRFDYWAWEDVVVPSRNYLSWFLISVGVSAPLSAVKIRTTTRLPTYYVAVQFLFMLSLLPLSL
jgi:bisanhydrobacterioruberin hydratase